MFSRMNAYLFHYEVIKNHAYNVKEPLQVERQKSETVF